MLLSQLPLQVKLLSTLLSLTGEKRPLHLKRLEVHLESVEKLKPHGADFAQWEEADRKGAVQRILFSFLLCLPETVLRCNRPYYPPEDIL